MKNSQLVKNILKTYARANDTDMSAGLAWYANANAIAQSFGAGCDRGAGVIAAYSPMSSWKRNLELAAAAFRGNLLPGLKDHQKKVLAILSGANPSEVLKGKKVRAFYNSIRFAGHVDDVVIDRHALSVALGRNSTEKERAKLDGKFYEELEFAYRTAAEKVGLRPADLQAIVWVTWRREKGIVD